MTNNNAAYSDMWQTCLSRIKEQTSEDEFVKWFKPIVPLAFDGTTLQLRVPNESYVYHIEKNYLSFLKPILYQLFGNKTRLRYVMPRNEQMQVTPAQANSDNTAIGKFLAQTDTANIKNPFILPGIRKAIIDPQLNPNYTFDSFVEGDCNRLARSAGLSIAVNPGMTPFNPLYIYGDSGLGKTHLAQAIGMEVKQRHPELQVLYVSMNRFQAQYTSSMLNKEFNDFIHFYQMIDVLIIDDIQELAGKEKTQNAFFTIFNHLQLSGKQLIITSDKPPVELKDIEERLITRFKWGLSAQLTQPDYETKVRIIRHKALRLKAELSDEVIDYLAQNINANIREIEGALSSLVANAAFLNKKITPALAREILKVYVQYSQKEITIEGIRKTVCEFLNIEPQVFDSPKRTREIAQARQIAMYLSKKYTKASLTQIGAAIGGKNHATVLHAWKAISNLIDTDKTFRRMMEEIERLAKAR
ncbi:chromosomal replication initiator protein DnaA [Alistipes sp. OttesenSCG-928-B03]|nr:chromosomal replication initiator protein DnaA [Alistipes sp. OttesenSCG-928-B03]